MAESAPAPADGAKEVKEAKKGVHPLVWVGIGCGGILIIGIAAVIIGGCFVASKVHDIATDQKLQDKLLGAATGTDVTTDAETGEKVFRDKKTGESVGIDVTAPGKDGSEGRITVRNPETGESMTAGAASTIPDGFPKAFPLYAGMQVVASSHMAMKKGENFSVAMKSDATPDAILAWYRAKLPAAGYDIKLDRSVPGKGAMLHLQRKGVADAVGYLVVGSGKDGKTDVSINLTEPKAP